MRSSYLVTYDIADDKRLRQVFQTMRGYGDHLQFSYLNACSPRPIWRGFGRSWRGSSIIPRTRCCSFTWVRPRGAGTASSRLWANLIRRWMRPASWCDHGYASCLVVSGTARSGIAGLYAGAHGQRVRLLSAPVLLRMVEGLFQESADTVEGKLQHKRVDKGGKGLPPPERVAEETLETRA